MPRRFAADISHAPGLFGTPDSGHCSSAATSASCARSSAMPTSRTMRVKPAISFADSMRQTASIARCVSLVFSSVTSRNQRDRLRRGKPGVGHVASPARELLLKRRGLRADPVFLLAQLGRDLRAEVVGLEHLPDLDLRFALGERIGAALDPFDRLFLRLDLKDPEAGDQLFCLRERSVDDGSLGAGEAY